MTPDPSAGTSAVGPEALREEARRIGFSLLGVARPDASEHMGFYRSWLERGAHGEMSYLERPDAVARRADPRRTLPTVRAVVVVADEYYAEDPPGVPDDPSIGVIARYARGRDYHRVIAAKLRRLLAWLEETSGRPVAGRIHTDTGPILERELAVRAGIGWFGKNTMLIHPRRGSWFFLGCLLVDLALEPDDPFHADHCGTCRRCLDACPTGALLGRNEHGAPVIDARRCIAYLTIEQKGPIPHALRPAIGNRVFGCDICQEVCPFNVRFQQDADEPGYAARGPGERPSGVEALPGENTPSGTLVGEGVSSGRRSPRAGDDDRPAPGKGVSAESSGRRHAHPGTRAPSLVDLMRLTPENWDAFSRGSAIRRAGHAGFKRNVAVAMGNWLAALDEPPEEAVAALREALDDEEPMVREHASWALERAGIS